MEPTDFTELNEQLAPPDEKPQSCDKKKLTKREAAEALNYIRKQHKRYRREQRMYHCPFCNAWHLTSKPFDQ